MGRLLQSQQALGPLGELRSEARLREQTEVTRVMASTNFVLPYAFLVFIFLWVKGTAPTA